MRYFCSDMHNPSSWIESEITDERAIIDVYCRKHFEISDADNGGDDTYYFAFSSGKYFEVYHYWWIETDSGWNLNNEYEVSEVSKDKTKGICEDRDWLKLIEPNMYVHGKKFFTGGIVDFTIWPHLKDGI